MSKILTIPSSIEEIKKTNSIVDGYIIGIKSLCVNVNLYIELSQIEEIINLIGNKEIFICINKNMHDADLELVKNTLLSLSKYNINGVLYYDTSVLTIYNSLDLNFDLVWSAEHYVTNYKTIDYWYEQGAKYSYLSSDITKDEIIEISEKCKAKLMVNMFGYLPMFVSKRHIVDNYLNYFNLSDNSNFNYIEKESKVYPIIDNEIGTSVYSSNILNGINEYMDISVEYIVLNSFNIHLADFVEVLNMFRKVNNDNVLEFNNKINSMFKNIDTGFLNKKTIYRVKKNEK